METQEQFEQRVCKRKIPFATRREAALAAQSMQRRGKDPVEPYRCQFCEQWHLGHRLSRKEKRARKQARLAAAT